MTTPVEGALGDLKILDFSRVLAGPLATMVLADLGASVTKVERPRAGDDTRSWGPPYDDRDVATYFLSVNRNKRSIVLDLRSAGDRDRARALALRADVLVENFRPGVMGEAGLGYEQLAAEHPRLIYCSITGFGRGAGTELAGYDLLVQALGGLMSITGEAGREPQKVGVALVDVLAGLFAATGILAALHRRELSGTGQRVEVDLLSSLLAALVNQGAAYTAAGVVGRRLGNEHPSVTPYEVYPCADGSLVVAVGNDRQFAALCELLGMGELAHDIRFAINSARVEHRAELRELLVEGLAKGKVSDWAREMTARRIPAGPVNDIAQAFELAAQLGLDPIVELPRPDGTTVPLTRNPIRLSATPASYRTAPPALGGE